MLIDTHCHLDAAEFDADRDAVASAARQSGVAGMVVPAVAPGNFAAVRACCLRYAGCFPAYGTHPLCVDQADEAGPAGLRAWLRDELAGDCRPVAVGEIGLDFHMPGVDASRQEFFYVEQLKIARDFDLPVLLHVRRAVDQILKGLRRTGVRKGIAHAFSGSRQQAEEFVRLGFRLGVGGAATYPGSTRIRQLAATLPIESLALETDAPDIPPAWLAGRRNAPGELGRIAEVLSELRNMSFDQLAMATTASSLALFAIRRDALAKPESMPPPRALLMPARSVPETAKPAGSCREGEKMS